MYSQCMGFNLQERSRCFDHWPIELNRTVVCMHACHVPRALCVNGLIDIKCFILWDRIWYLYGLCVCVFVFIGKFDSKNIHEKQIKRITKVILLFIDLHNARNTIETSPAIHRTTKTTLQAAAHLAVPLSAVRCFMAFRWLQNIGLSLCLRFPDQIKLTLKPIAFAYFQT